MNLRGLTWPLKKISTTFPERVGPNVTCTIKCLRFCLWKWQCIRYKNHDTNKYVAVTSTCVRGQQPKKKNTTTTTITTTTTTTATTTMTTTTTTTTTFQYDCCCHYVHQKINPTSFFSAETSLQNLGPRAIFSGGCMSSWFLLMIWLQTTERKSCTTS